jgi:Mg2+ and Co2+ transporter CorA
VCRHLAGNSEPGGSPERKEPHMGYGIVGILVIILIVLAIIYFAKRV